jgi:uncharacterized protein
MPLHAGAPAREPFPCTQCGACCRHVDLSEETRFLDRGDGACRHYDAANKSCLIYAERPLVCRVDQYYDTHYARFYRWKDFEAMNLAACARLRAMEGPDVVGLVGLSECEE